VTSLTPPNDEDLIGRRVLNGLGLVERQLLPVCRKIFGRDVSYEEGTWALTRRLLLYAWANLNMHAGPRFDFRIEAYTVKKDAEILERFELWDPDDKQRPIYMVRLKDTKQSLTYSLWEQADIGLTLKPPYKVIEEYTMGDGYQIAVQDTKHFVAQFAPYEWDKVIDT